MFELNGQRRIAAFFVACVLALSLGACKRDANQVPELQGAKPVDLSQKLVGFGLLSAGRDEEGGQAALVLEFSQALANAQEFDRLLVVKGPKDAMVKGS